MKESVKHDPKRPAENETPAPAGEAPPEKSRVFIVDDHTMFREGLRQLIEYDPGLTVCGGAPDAEKAM